MPTRVVNGQTYKVFSGYVFDSGTSGNYFYVDDPYVLFENVRFITSGQVSNTSAMVQQSSANRGLIINTSDFDGGPYHQRGIQADYGVQVSSSEFTRFGNSAVEMNDRSATKSMLVENSYLYEPKGWNPTDHTDGIQVGGGKDITIRNNTVLIEPYGGTNGDTSYVSNSALGLWAELGNVGGTVVVNHNRIAGGGRVVYLQQKAPYAWQGSVTVSDNVFDQCFTPQGGVWGPLYTGGLPGQLTWTNNTWSSGTSLSLQDALTLYP